jgi:hypothetical protein
MRAFLLSEGSSVATLLIFRFSEVFFLCVGFDASLAVFFLPFGSM